MRPRIVEELQLLSRYYPDIQHAESAGDDWFCVLKYAFPDGWRISENPIEIAPVVFRATAAYPTSEPYGFLVPAKANYRGSSPGNSGSPPVPVPFGGEWLHLSWAPDGSWAPTAVLEGGSNLLHWVRSFRLRLNEGA